MLRVRLREACQLFQILLQSSCDDCGLIRRLLPLKSGGEEGRQTAFSDDDCCRGEVLRVLELSLERRMETSAISRSKKEFESSEFGRGLARRGYSEEREEDESGDTGRGRLVKYPKTSMWARVTEILTRSLMEDNESSARLTTTPENYTGSITNRYGTGGLETEKTDQYLQIKF